MKRAFFLYYLLVFLVGLGLLSSCSSYPELQCKEAPDCNADLQACEQDLDECIELGKDCQALCD